MKLALYDVGIILIFFFPALSAVMHIAGFVHVFLLATVYHFLGENFGTTGVSFYTTMAATYFLIDKATLAALRMRDGV